MEAFGCRPTPKLTAAARAPREMGYPELHNVSYEDSARATGMRLVLRLARLDRCQLRNRPGGVTKLEIIEPAIAEDERLSASIDRRAWLARAANRRHR
jgi:hypothetical protein